MCSLSVFIPLSSISVLLFISTPLLCIIVFSLNFFTFWTRFSMKKSGTVHILYYVTGVASKTSCPHSHRRACQDFLLLQNQVPIIRDCGSFSLFIVFFSFIKDLSGVFLLLFGQFASFPIGNFPTFPTTYFSHNCP